MLAPSRAARSAIASPMPREAPVMKSVWFLSGMVVIVARMERKRNPCGGMHPG